MSNHPIIQRSRQRTAVSSPAIMPKAAGYGACALAIAFTCAVILGLVP